MDTKLGFCNPPEPIHLYIKKEEIDGKSCLWYQFDHDNNKQIPVESRAIAGYLQDIRITVKEFKTKENAKLELVINADETYVLRSGIETNFSKSILLALSQVSDFSKPLIFAVLPGNENVVFGKVYDAKTKQRISVEWNPSADFYGLINQIEVVLHNNKVDAGVWRNWRTPEDALTWAKTQLPEYAPEFLVQEFAQLPATNGKKAPAWVKRVQELKGF